MFTFTITLLLLLADHQEQKKIGKVDTSGVILVRSAESWGQVCPIDEQRAWTAQHVTSEKTAFGDDKVVPLVFSAPGDTQGTVLEIYSDKRRDLAVVEAVLGKFSRFYTVATEAPKKGDYVTMVGIDEDFLPLVVRARLKSVIAGSLIYDNTPGPGSSGSCVLNEAGELIGINTAGKYKKDGSGFSRGMGWALYGTWGEVPERFRRSTLSSEPTKPAEPTEEEQPAPPVSAPASDEPLPGAASARATGRRIP